MTQIDIKRSLDFRTVATGGPLAGATLEHDTAAWSGEQTHVGVVLGAGMQYALGHNVSLGVEYLRTTYANADYVTQGTGTTIIGTVAPAPTKFNFGANAIENGYSDTIRAVLNYKFGDYERGPLK